MASQKISFIVPVYNEEKNIPLLYNEILKISDQLTKYQFELIFINDGSHDTSWDEIAKISQDDTRVKAIDFSRNFGHQAAITAGYVNASGNAIISLDCDMQDPPSVIVDLVNEWEKGFEVVYARRKKRSDNFLKKYTALAYYHILGFISDTQIPRNVGDFRLIDAKVHRAFLKLSEKDRYIRGMFAWIGFKTTFVDFERPERIHGETGYTWKKMMKLAMDGILNFSLFPLKLGFIIGVIIIGLSICFTLYITYDSLINGVRYELIKWISAVMFGCMGLQFIFMWILGEYIGRIYNETRDRPVYIERETLNF